MRIVCLAWGSLLWKAEPLRLEGEWRPDGPPLPIEFARVGDNGELATVICPGAPVHRVRWAGLATADLDEAREQLREREQIDPALPRFVGSLRSAAAPGTSGAPTAAADAYPHGAEIAAWASRAGIDAVVWTALPPRHDGTDGRVPTAREAVAYLQGLRGERRAHAEDYVRRVPDDIRTPTRDAIEAALGWTPRPAPP